MHTLYVTAHAITVALNAYGKDLVRESHAQGRPIPLSAIHTAYAVPPTVAWLQRATRCENLAQHYLAGRFVTAAHGEATRPADDYDRLPRALARWDIQAHRTLAHDPSAANLVLITRSQALITGASLALLDAAEPGQNHAVDEAPHLGRARAAITHAAASWSQLGSRWHDLTRASDRLDPALARAAAEVRAAFRDSPTTSPPRRAQKPSRPVPVSPRCRRQPGRARGRQPTRPRGSRTSRSRRPLRTGPRALPSRTQRYRSRSDRPPASTAIMCGFLPQTSSPNVSCPCPLPWSIAS